MYEFNRNTSTIWLYYKLLEAFSKTFLGRNMGKFHFAYSQKIENGGLVLWLGLREH